jgi:hypothetical protein
MRGDVETRLRKLEAGLPSAIKPQHVLIGTTDKDCEAQKRDMIKSGQADGSDEFFFVLLVGANPMSRVIRMSRNFVKAKSKYFRARCPRN